MLPSLEQIWELCLRTSSTSLLEDRCVEYTMIAIYLEWGENISRHSFSILTLHNVCDAGLDVTL